MKNDASDRKQNANYFRFVGFFWSSLILFGMITLYLFAFVITPRPMQPDTPLSLLAVLQGINYYIVEAFGSRQVLVYIFKAAVVAHLIEGLYALNISVDMGCTNTCSTWMLQTAIVGYPSLKLLLLKREEWQNRNI